ncbi:unnamed protein product [Chrysoparadoxa australica]
MLCIASQSCFLFLRLSACFFQDATCGVTVYKQFKLVLMVGIDGDARSCIFASALISHEDEDSFEWILEQYKEMTQGAAALSCIFSDREPALIAAIDKLRPRVGQFTCKWHIMKNIRKKLLRYISFRPSRPSIPTKHLDDALQHCKLSGQWQAASISLTCAPLTMPLTLQDVRERFGCILQSTPHVLEGLPGSSAVQGTQILTQTLTQREMWPRKYCCAIGCMRG